MPGDIWFGPECEIRIGRRANAATPPTSSVWQAVEFMQLTVNPTQEWRERPKLGVPGKRQNVLDPIRPRKGFFRLTAELVIDMDSRQLPIWLRHSLGAPAAAVENGDLYDHVWVSGVKAEMYFDLQVKVGANDVRIYEGLTLANVAANVGGENTQDFDGNLSLVGLSRRKVNAFEGNAPIACPAEAPILRAQYLVDDVAADNTLSATFSYNRALSEGLFLSTTPTVSSNRPTAGGGHTMSATFRAIGEAFDDIEADETVFASAINFLGVEEDHRIRFEQPQSMLAPAALPIAGAGMIERTFNSAGHQSDTVPASRITVTNDVASYT